jgi:hypothetical protein
MQRNRMRGRGKSDRAERISHTIVFSCCGLVIHRFLYYLCELCEGDGAVIASVVEGSAIACLQELNSIP